MSIIPGIENFAPERTLTSSGFAGSPKPLPVRRSTSSHRLEDVLPEAVGQLLAARRSSRCRPAVVIVKPGGVGRPALVISARPAPLPPSRSFIVPLPSAVPSPQA